MSSKIEGITPEELDELVDEGKENVLQYFDLDNLRRGDTKRINLDLPIGFLTALDREALKRGVTRQSLIKVWLYERLVPAWSTLKPTSEITAIHGVPEIQGIAGFSALGLASTKPITIEVPSGKPSTAKKRPERKVRK